MCTTGKRAFTIVEIMVVLLIMAVTLTLTTLSLSGGAAGVAARESATRLLGALRYAHDYAVVHGCPCRVSFSRQDNAYHLTCRAETDEDRFEPLPGGGAQHLDRRVCFAGIVIQPRQEQPGGADVITFEPTGECDGARIELTDGRMVYTVVVSPCSGLVRLHKGSSREIPSDREDLDAT